MKFFIEGYDQGNDGDVLMASACLLLASQATAAELILPRPLRFDPMGVLGITRFRVQEPHATLLNQLGLTKRPPSYRLSDNLRRARRGDVVLYCNGFIFGDYWPENWIRQLTQGMERQHKRGVRIVLMPQSFGPFSRPGHADLIRRAMRSVTVACARDQTSYQYLREIGIATERLNLSADYTWCLNTIPSVITSGMENRACIIPNIKIFERFNESTGQKYLTDLAKFIRELRSQTDCTITILPHTTKKGDHRLCQQLADLADAFVDPKTDPIEKRRYIGASRFVITSRFHGLMNALCQNVPALAMGWAHKYAELLRIYGVKNCSIDVSQDIPHSAVIRNFVSREVELRQFLRETNSGFERKYIAPLRAVVSEVAAKNEWSATHTTV